MTLLERLQTKGIRRKGSPKDGFHYERADGERVLPEDLQRIKFLRVPPAWTDAAINISANGTLQAVGKDAAGRWQYLYHEKHTRRQEQKKFSRLIAFIEAQPKMRRTVKRHLTMPGLGRERVMACILRILSKCFMRPGSEVYAKENGSYGIATLRPKHVQIKGDLVEFDFRGKSGVRQHRKIKDKEVAKVVRELLREPAKEVFKYCNEEGQFVDVKRRHINQYIEEVMGSGFSAKDFRTLAGTLICACALAQEASEPAPNKSARKRRVVAAIKQTAVHLGNTPAVCRSSYISPIVLNSYEKGKVIENNFKTLEDLVNHDGRLLYRSHKALLRLLNSTGGPGS